MSDIVIFLRGGVYQGAISNHENDRIMVVNYDDEIEPHHIHREFETIPVEQKLFRQVLNATEE